MLKLRHPPVSQGDKEVFFPTYLKCMHTWMYFFTQQVYSVFTTVKYGTRCWTCIFFLFQSCSIYNGKGKWAIPLPLLHTPSHTRAHLEDFPNRSYVKICREFLFHGLSLAQRLLALRSATQPSQVQITMIHLCLLGLCSCSHYSAFDIYRCYFFPNFSLLLEGDICDSKNSHKLMHAQYLAKCLANIRCNIEVSWIKK